MNETDPNVMPYEDFAREVEPEVGRLLTRHLSNAKIWVPEHFIPLSQAEDFVPGEIWTPGNPNISPGVSSALVVNLLTEDNLPYYLETINRMMDIEAWHDWAHRWTAEEMRHSIVIRGYIMARRLLDPVKLEADRMVQVDKAEVPQPPTPQEGIAYTAIQELATRVSHANTGKHLDKAGDAAGGTVMSVVAGDEHLHYFFYVDLGKYSFKIDPSGMMIAAAKRITKFEMPGTGIPDFKRHAAKIAMAGIYDLAAYRHKVVEPVLDKWEVWDLEDLSDEAKLARDGLKEFLHKTDMEIERRAGRQAERQARAEARI